MANYGRKSFKCQHVNYLQNEKGVMASSGRSDAFDKNAPRTLLGALTPSIRPTHDNCGKIKA